MPIKWEEDLVDALGLLDPEGIHSVDMYIVRSANKINASELEDNGYKFVNNKHEDEVVEYYEKDFSTEVVDQQGNATTVNVKIIIT
jgi:Pyruvate/2-oxoacid:ferredoxin oxidoreductase gamma subunit